VKKLFYDELISLNNKHPSMSLKSKSIGMQPSTMEIRKTIEHNPRECKLNEKHNKAQNT
jgi:hypothetical protein